MPNIEEPERVLRTELKQYSNRRSTEGPYADDLDIDVLIVGAGFSGSYLLHEMREAGYRTVLYDAGTSFGGTWRWNVYPGARVDSEVPLYQLSIKGTWETWNYSTNYPGWDELQAYFDHVDKCLNLSKDCSFETVVTGAEFDTDEGKWHVRTEDGRLAKAKYLIIAAGFAAKRYVPDFSGMNKFKGESHHSSFWPPEDVPVEGKRVAVVGTGASGVQIAQEWSTKVKTMHVFQRTPNLAIPMGKKPMSKEDNEAFKATYPETFKKREECFSGFHYDFHDKNTFEVSEEERQAHYQELFKIGGFRFWLGNFKDYLFDEKANRAAYDFWAKTQRERIKNPKKKDILCPLEPPHPFGVKRPCLEQRYFEALDQDNVEVIDISKTSGNEIQEFTEKGIKTSDGKEYEFDVIALATGFDVTTGGMTNMGLKSIHGTYLKDEWKAAANTYLGTTISGYPNMFHLYGPHGPTLLSNGPTCAEVQGRWIRDAINAIQAQGLKYIDPTPEATAEWKKHVNELTYITLFPKTVSTYMGSNIPGKAFEPVCYAGGMKRYNEEIHEKLPNWSGFSTVAVKA